jgi:predicted PurR-regulated permease PerM
MTVTLTALLLYLMWLMVQPFVTTLLWAIVLTIIALPIHNRFCAWGWKPTLAAMTTLVLVLVLVGVPLFYIIKAVIAQTTDAIAPTQEAIRNLFKEDSRLSQWIADRPQLKTVLDPAALGERVKSVGAWVAARSVGLVGNVVLLVAQLGVVIFTAFYMLRDRGSLMEGLKRFLPMSDAQSESIFVATLGVTSASLRGTLIVSAVQGSIGGLTFWMLGLTAPLLWGVLMFIAAMVPLFGSALVWGPAAIYLAITGAWGKALILTAVGSIVIGLVDNVLRPILVGARTRMHELVVFFAILGGIEVFGALGIIIGPVIVALTVAFLLVFYQIGDDKPSADKAQELLETVVPEGVAPALADATQPQASAPAPTDPMASLAGAAKVPVSPTRNNEHVDEHAEGETESNHP